MEKSVSTPSHNAIRENLNHWNGKTVKQMLWRTKTNVVEKGNHENKWGRGTGRRNQDSHYYHHSNDDDDDSSSSSSHNEMIILETRTLTDCKQECSTLTTFTVFCHREQYFSVCRAIPVNSSNYLNYRKWLCTKLWYIQKTHSN